MVPQWLSLTTLSFAIPTIDSGRKKEDEEEEGEEEQKKILDFQASFAARKLMRSLLVICVKRGIF